MRRQVIPIAGAALCAALCGAAPASATTAASVTWRYQAIPEPANTGQARLLGVSCPARGACTAVGSYLNHATGRTDTLAEHWDGTSWAVQPTPNPARTESTTLTSVSCVPAAGCTAVADSSRGALAEHWDGASWSIQSVPAPAGVSNTRLGAVSCASPTSCTAVGYYYFPQNDNQMPLAEHWDGTSWTVQQVPLPSGAFQASLGGVSCTAGSCIAVGSYNGSTTGGIPFAELWNGTTWTVQAVPGPAGNPPSSVSCSSPDACTAVGGSLAERWNGTTWTTQTIPGTVIGVIAVSCPSATACTAVGTAGHSAVAEHWNGISWAAQTIPPVPHHSTASVELFGVSCQSAAYCTAVGYYNTRVPLAYHQ